MKPWMSHKEIETIEKYLKPSDIFLEWGSGGSTLYFSGCVKEYISIEYDIRWYKNIANLISINQLQNINYLYCAPDNGVIPPVKSSKSKKEDFVTYVSIIDNLSQKIYDKILIDGRSRVECAKKIINYLNDDSIVFIHDFFNRKKYFSILEYYTIIDSVQYGQSLAVLKKKP
jgi:hypothetical protein